MPGAGARPWIPRQRWELSMRLTPLLTAVLPPLTGFQIDQVRVAEAEITVTVHPQRRTARCPLCQRRARRGHSRYTRTRADLGGVRQIVCERLADPAPRSQRPAPPPRAGPGRGGCARS